MGSIHRNPCAVHERLRGATFTRLENSVGIGLRTSHCERFHDQNTPPPVTWLEVLAENYFDRGGIRHKMLSIIAERYPISVHGVALSLGSPEGIEPEHLERLASLVADVDACLVSEHLAWSRLGEVYYNGLLPLPLTDETLDVVSANMAEQFVASHPPNHGWLSAYGADFADFVAQYRPAADLGYLADVARIEWARTCAANALDAPGLDLTALGRIDPEALEGLPLSLHVAASLVYSPFPAFDIWRAHQHAGDDEKLAHIDLAIGPQTTLVFRPAALEVGVALLGPGDVAFLSALARHLPFGAAYQAAVLEEADYDLSCRLGDLVCMRALAAFTA